MIQCPYCNSGNVEPRASITRDHSFGCTDCKGTFEPPTVVDHPPHYTSHPSGVECIEIVEHMNFCTGNAFKYVWRADLKDGKVALEKALWYLRRKKGNEESLDEDKIGQVMAHETNPIKALILWHILVADRVSSDKSIFEHLTQAGLLIQEMIDGFDAKAASR